MEALAEKIGVDARNLPTTVNRFNNMADTLDDQDFDRGKTDYDRFYGDRSREGAAATLGALVKPPFHAVEIHMGALGTNGGARTNAQAQILDVDGEPIAGLFGAGNVIKRADRQRLCRRGRDIGTGTDIRISRRSHGAPAGQSMIKSIKDIK